jgi:hypothetical protein
MMKYIILIAIMFMFCMPATAHNDYIYTSGIAGFLSGMSPVVDNVPPVVDNVTPVVATPGVDTSMTTPLGIYDPGAEQTVYEIPTNTATTATPATVAVNNTPAKTVAPATQDKPATVDTSMVTPTGYDTTSPKVVITGMLNQDLKAPVFTNVFNEAQFKAALIPLRTVETDINTGTWANDPTTIITVTCMPGHDAYGALIPGQYEYSMSMGLTAVGMRFSTDEANIMSHKIGPSSTTDINVAWTWYVNQLHAVGY